jgi:TonB family protein
MTRRLLTSAAVFVITVFCAGAIEGQQPSQWQRYSTEGFSVLLPELPRTIEVGRPQKMFERQLKARQFSAYEDKVVYVILAFHNPQGRHPLSRFIDEITKYSISAKAETLDRDISGVGFTGKQYSFSQGTRLKGILRFYETKDDVFALEAVGPDIENPSVSRFFDSFTIGPGDGTKHTFPPDDPASTPADQTFRGRELTLRAHVVVKPEPMYTEAARQNQITGTVVLSATLAPSGKVTDLFVMKSLPHGLTERAMAAARNIRFIPAQKDGHEVGQFVQLEYNFNLY